MHWVVESGQTSYCLLWFVLCSDPCRRLSLSALFLSVFSLLSVSPYSALTPLSSFVFVLLSAKSSPSLPVSFRSPLFLAPPRSLSFLHHKHFQCWHTRVDSHPESSATTIMSMLSSHNNTRITCWGRQALLGAGSQTWLPWIQSVNTTQTHACWSVKYGVEFPHYVLFLDWFLQCLLFSCSIFVFRAEVLL